MKLFLIIFLALSFAACQSESKQNRQDHSQHTQSQAVSDTAKGSPQRVSMANIGNAHVHIEYNSPAVRKRMIWGGLVALGEVWVTGAHNATSISFSENVKIAGKTIEKGKYAFFTIPNKDEWTLILNKNWEQHLTDEYSEKEDVLRWKAKPDSTEHTERLSFKVVPKDEKSGFIEFAWEKVKITIPIQQIQ
ncbi:DUF2911 domain-containing protein [Eisenibacter elegans]|uniref:DUF2911 domain-containing protein n=1 Tax=Eisenibacter elegans TaxID=997 RepID=UPI00047A1064|nr:DUF2911 domain-containing protein [Eisenibacter elegans]